ncbi:MAG: hypothetical protein E6Q97_34845 [Desulfurellales bacterium]|nr:MAG: hypothetical protein E6Q97_34845 [Desulfurellales bacterium]
MDIASLKGKSQAELLAIIAAMNAKQPKGLSIKVSAKGAVAVYGLGRFPVTLYKSQWDKLLAEAETIKAFIEANASILSVKD